MEQRRLTMRRRKESGAAMLEALLCMFVIAFILFGLLQLFQLSIAQMVTDYASFRAARSASVGFSDYLVSREGKVKAIPVSGSIVEPELSIFGNPSEQFDFERSAVRDYLDGTRYLEYEYWNASNSGIHYDYRCPSYGTRRNGSCSICSARPELNIRSNLTSDLVDSTLIFSDYPMTIPGYHFFTSGRETEIKSGEDIKVANYAQDYLD